MKQVLIIANDLEIGGAEKALLGLLETIDVSKVSIDLFLLKHSGQWLRYLPEKINLLPEIRQYTSMAVPVWTVIKKKCFGVLLGRTIGKIMAGKYIKTNGITGINSVGVQYSFKYTKPFFPMISDKEYDVVIGFSTPFYIPIEKAKGKRKITWIHTDYSKIAGDREEETDNWNKYDELIAVSDSVRDSFISTYPDLDTPVSVIENIIPEQLIHYLSEQSYDEFSKDFINLLSIGRYTYAKNFDNVPEICSNILKTGLKIRWYIIGYGAEEEKIKEKIRQFHMENNVILLGKIANPYPYIKKCDCYIQPSRFEGKSVSVQEAQMLGKPVIITDYPTSANQLENYYDGIIVPLENAECSKRIAEILSDSDLLSRLSNNCKKNNYSHRSEVDKIYKIFET